MGQPGNAGLCLGSFTGFILSLSCSFTYRAPGPDPAAPHIPSPMLPCLLGTPGCCSIPHFPRELSAGANKGQREVWFRGRGWDGAPVLVLSPRAGLTPPAVTGVRGFFKPLEGKFLVLPCPARSVQTKEVGGAGRDARDIPSGRVRGAASDPGEVPGVGGGCAESLRDAVSPQPGDLGHSVTVEGVGAGPGEVNAVISRGRGSPTDGQMGRLVCRSPGPQRRVPWQQLVPRKRLR